MSEKALFLIDVLDVFWPQNSIFVLCRFFGLEQPHYGSRDLFTNFLVFTANLHVQSGFRMLFVVFERVEGTWFWRLAQAKCAFCFSCFFSEKLCLCVYKVERVWAKHVLALTPRPPPSPLPLRP